METRVYVIDTFDLDIDVVPTSWDDERFMSEAESQGGVYTLEGFQEAFNRDDTINSGVDFIRFIKVETWE